LGSERRQLVVKRRLVVVADDPRHPGAGDARPPSRRQLGELSEHGWKLRFGFIQLVTEHVLGRLIQPTPSAGAHRGRRPVGAHQFQLALDDAVSGGGPPPPGPPNPPFPMLTD